MRSTADGSRLTRWERSEFLRRSPRVCSYCGQTGSELGPDGEPWHIDHVIPLSSGGETSPANLTRSCATCDAIKGMHTLAELPAALHRRIEHTERMLAHRANWPETQ